MTKNLRLVTTIKICNYKLDGEHNLIEMNYLKMQSESDLDFILR